MDTNDEPVKTTDPNKQIDQPEAASPAWENTYLEDTYSPNNVQLLRSMEQSRQAGSPSSPNGAESQQAIANNKGIDATQFVLPLVTFNNDENSQTPDSALFAQADAKPKTDKSSTQSVFTEPYNKEKAQALIKQLGDNTFNTRITARDTLQKMGPQVLPDLERAVKESDDPEVRLRANEAIRYVRDNSLREDTNKYLAQADKSTERTENLLGKAGISIDREKRQIADAAGNVETIGPSQTYGDPPGNLTAADRKGFEEMIRQGDALAGDKRFNEIQGQVKEHGEWDNYVKLATLDWSKDGRKFYARALSASNDPKDHQKGIELLTERMQKNKDYKPGWGFMETATRLGAHNNEAFMKAFRSAGGNVDELKKAAEELRQRRR